MTEGHQSKTKPWIRGIYWVGLGIIVGQALVTAFGFARLPDVIVIGSFAGQPKLGPRATIWLFPVIATVMVALPRLFNKLPTSGLESAAGPEATAANEAVAEVVVVAIFVFAATCVSGFGLVCILENLSVGAHAALERVIIALFTVVPPLLAFALALFARRNRGVR